MRRITIGQFPALSVLEARNVALATKSAIVRGEDPERKRADLRAEVTFADLPLPTSNATQNRGNEVGAKMMR